MLAAAAPDLPPEVIHLVTHHLERAHIVQLLTLNRHWHRVIVAELYRVVRIRSLAEQQHYRNLFYETRRTRHGSSSSSFYSSTNYAAYVRQLDLSHPYAGKAITNEVLHDLTVDCSHLESLNIYNCHLITTRGLRRVLEHCPIRHLFVAMATGLNAKCLLAMDTLRRLETLNLHGLASTHFFRPVVSSPTTAPLPLHVHTLRLTGPLPATLIPGLAPTLRDLALEAIDHDHDDGPLQQLLEQAPPRLEHLRLKGLHLTSLAHVPRHLRTLELTQCQLPPSPTSQHVAPPACLPHLTHLHLRTTPVPAIDTWIRQCSQRLVAFTAPPDMPPSALDALAERCPRLAHLTLTSSASPLAAELDRALRTTWAPTLVSLDVGASFVPCPMPRLEYLHMRFPVPPSWLLTAITPDLFPALRVLFISRMHPTPADEEHLAPWLDRLDAFMLHSQYYREPTERLVKLREQYEYWTIQKDIW